MSIDYDANYGIGYEVEPKDDLDLSVYDDDLGWYLDSEIQSAYKFYWFKCGSDYNDFDYRWYIGILSPFNEGLDLTKKKKELDEELERLKLNPIGEFNEIGGLYIY